MSRVIGQGSTITTPLQDSTATTCLLVSAMFILERIVSTQGGRVASPALVQTRRSKFWEIGLYKHLLPKTRSPLSPENRKSPLEYTQLLCTQVSGRWSQYKLQFWYRKGIFRRHSHKRFPLLIPSSRKALYIHQRSQQSKITSFNQPIPRKEPSEIYSVVSGLLSLVSSH